MAHRLIAWTSSLLAAALVAALITPRSASFPSAFAFLWVPAAVVVSLAALFRSPPHFTGGVAGACCAILLLYYGWVKLMTAPDPLAWAGYVMCMPGAFAGAALARLGVRLRPASKAVETAAAWAGTTAGFWINLYALLD